MMLYRHVLLLFPLIIMGQRVVTVDNDVGLCYQEFGNASSTQKVLFIMGYQMAQSSWSSLITAILDRNMSAFHLVTFDNRGVGCSDTPVSRSVY